MIPEIHLQPTQWEILPALETIPPLDDSDAYCLAELAAVLARYGKLKKFGIQLLHVHFSLGPGEVLIERPDSYARTQQISVGRLDDEPPARPTSWAFDERILHFSDAVYCTCVSSPLARGACTAHAKTNTPGQAKINEDRVMDRRIQRENATYDQGFPVAGDDPRQRPRSRE